MGQRRVPSLIAPGGLNRAAAARGAGLLLLRLGPAGVFLAHGYLKLLGGHHDRAVALFLTVNIPSPETMAWVIGALELLGGLALLLGVLARPFALLLAVEMAVAIGKVRLAQGFVGAAEYELVILFACLAVALLGSGSLALSRVFKPRADPAPGV